MWRYIVGEYCAWLAGVKCLMLLACALLLVIDLASYYCTGATQGSCRNTSRISQQEAKRVPQRNHALQ